MSRIASAFLSASGSGPLIGQDLFTACGGHTWTVPNGVTCVSAVVLSAGTASHWGCATNYAGGYIGPGGFMAWGHFPVTPGETYCIHVGCSISTYNECGLCRRSYIQRVSDSVCMLYACCNSSGLCRCGGCCGGSSVYFKNNSNNGANGGGAAGYTANGGCAGQSSGYHAGCTGTGFDTSTNPTGGGGGGSSQYDPSSGGSRGISGGGVGIYGCKGTGGRGGANTYSPSAGVCGYGRGGNGSCGGCGSTGGHGSNTSSGNLSRGNPGAVRIIYPGDQRYYPGTRTDNE